jgi:hypothetical protein
MDAATTRTIETFHDFFVASAGVAGALIGLLFVAVSVAGERLVADTDGHVNRVRASAALTGFTNALVISLFALNPVAGLDAATIAVAIVGMTFVAASLLSFVRVRGLHRQAASDAAFLIGLLVVLVLELRAGIRMDDHPRGALNEVAILLVVSFIIGIGRSWELLGGPQIGLVSELRGVLRTRGRGEGEGEGP